MLFYSRQNGRDGEKDFLDTNDFRDVYFENDGFRVMSNEDGRSQVDYKLEYVEDGNKIFFIGTSTVSGKVYSARVEITEPYLLVEQGAQAYYDEKMLDDIAIIKESKTIVFNNIKDQLLNDDHLLIGTSLDTMGLINNDGNTIGVIDGITINNDTEINVDRFYSILDLTTVNTGTVDIFISNGKKLVGTISKIESNEKISITFSSKEIVAVDEEIEFKRNSEFKTREAYDEDRAKYIKVGATSESDFDEFDDLF